MDNCTSIYSDIAVRTQGDIYIGVVGPVRTGKSTFIKKFMDLAVLPKIDNDFKRNRTMDELPQSAGGRTIMTTEPKFIPNEAVEISIGNTASFKMRMIDCVGYIVNGAQGYLEDEAPRMVMSPWSDTPIPFARAAEIGTKKVITEHSTVGIVVTTDGSITDINREDYLDAEARVINELQEYNKPFVVILNSINPTGEHAAECKKQIEDKFGVTVIPLNCMNLTESDIETVMESILYEFPVKEILFNIPRWIQSLKGDNKLKSDITSSIFDNTDELSKISDAIKLRDNLCSCEHISSADIKRVDGGAGVVEINIVLPDSLYFKTLKQETSFDLNDKYDILRCLSELSEMKREYDKILPALTEVKQKGYGIVSPALEELTLEEPEIVKQGSRFGVRLKASAPSIHMMRNKPKSLAAA